MSQSPPPTDPGRRPPNGLSAVERRRPSGRIRRAARVLVSAWPVLMRIGAIVGMSVIAALIHPRALAALGVLAALLLAGVLYPHLAVRAVRATWTYPGRRGEVGKPLSVRLRIRSAFPLPAFGVLLRGGWSDPGGEDPTLVGVTRVPLFRTLERAPTVVPVRRGVYPDGPSTVETAFPFGFWRATRSAHPTGHLIVWPEIVPLEPAAGSGGGGQGLSLRPRRIGDHGEFAGVRPHRPGESLRRVHWKQTARHDELIVSERCAGGRREVIVVIDTDPGAHARNEQGDSLEKALSVGASAAQALADAGVEVTLAFDRGGAVRVGNGHQLATALDALARFEPRRGAGVEALLAGLPRRSLRSESPVVVTTVAGWERSRKARRRFLLIDERGEAVGGSSGVVPERHTLVPLYDPGNARLRRAWQEVAGGVDGLV